MRTGRRIVGDKLPDYSLNLVRQDWLTVVKNIQLYQQLLPATSLLHVRLHSLQ